MLQGFVAAGLGVTLLPDLALPTLRADLVVRPTDPPAPDAPGLGRDARGGPRSAGDRGDASAILVEVGERFATAAALRLQVA